MPPKARKKRATRHGMFVYCKREEKGRIKAAAAHAGKSLSDYILAATMPKVEQDERRIAKKG